MKVGCAEWLRGMVEEWPVLNHDTVKAEAEENGFSRTQLQAAVDELGLITVNDYKKRHGQPKNWYWVQLPDEEDGHNA